MGEHRSNDHLIHTTTFASNQYGGFFSLSPGDFFRVMSKQRTNWYEVNVFL